MLRALCGMNTDNAGVLTLSPDQIAQLEAFYGLISLVRSYVLAMGCGEARSRDVDKV